MRCVDGESKGGCDGCIRTTSAQTIGPIGRVCGQALVKSKHLLLLGVPFDLGRLDERFCISNTVQQKVCDQGAPSKSRN